DGLAILGDGFVHLAFFQQGKAEVVVGRGKILVETDSLTVLGDGPVPLTLRSQGTAEDIVGSGQVLAQMDNLPQLGDGQVQPALGIRGIVQAEPRPFIPGIQLEARMYSAMASSSALVSRSASATPTRARALWGRAARAAA